MVRELRLCIKCKIEKDISEFYADSRNSKWKNNVCKPCNYLRVKDWADNNKIRLRKLQRERQWIKKGILNIAEANLYRDSIKSCEICDEEENLVIDHNHISGDIRGVLCRGCNVGIGNLKDNPDLLEKAATYLRKC